MSVNCIKPHIFAKSSRPRHVDLCKQISNRVSLSSHIQYGDQQAHLLAAMRSRSRTLMSTHAEAAGDGNWQEGFREPESERAGSEEWRKRRPAVTLPAFARRAEHTFLMAAFLKIFMLASVVPTQKIFKPLGYTPEGIMAWLVLLPFAALLSFLASSLLRSDFMRRKGSGFGVLLLCSALLMGTGKLYAPRPIVRRPGVTRTVTAEQREEARRQAAMRSPALRTAEDADRMWEDKEARKGK